jgi:hypothetical protein
MAEAMDTTLQDEIDPAVAALWLDDETLDEIVGVVGNPPRDREGLRCELLLYITLYSIVSNLGRVKVNRELLKNANDVRTSANRIKHLLPLETSSRIEELDQSPWLKMTPRELADQIKAAYGVKGSALQWLEGYALKKVFIKYFGLEVKFRRVDGDFLVGPYLDFCEQVLGKADIPYSRETIAKACGMYDSMQDAQNSN